MIKKGLLKEVDSWKMKKKSNYFVMWAIKEINSKRVRPSSSTTDCLTLLANSAALRLISFPSSVAMSVFNTFSMVADLTKSCWWNSLTLVPIFSTSVIRKALHGWSECIGQAAIGTPILMLSVHEFHPQWLRNPPIDKCPRISNWGCPVSNHNSSCFHHLFIPFWQVNSPFVSASWITLIISICISQYPNKLILSLLQPNSELFDLFFWQWNWCSKWNQYDRVRSLLVKPFQAFMTINIGGVSFWKYHWN